MQGGALTTEKDGRSFRSEPGKVFGQHVVDRSYKGSPGGIVTCLLEFEEYECSCRTSNTVEYADPLSACVSKRSCPRIVCLLGIKFYDLFPQLKLLVTI
jgi:hypothetical protein